MPRATRAHTSAYVKQADQQRLSNSTTPQKKRREVEKEHWGLKELCGTLCYTRAGDKKSITAQRITENAQECFAEDDMVLAGS